ncbi:MAG: hypothetical protein V4463_00155 [Pseudomonadota bacterium]
MAIPLQGFAAASMVLCQNAPAAPIIGAQDNTGKMDHCAAATTMKKCSNCAACSVGAAIAPPALPQLATEAAGSEPVSTTSPFATSPVDQALERPPHALRA